MNPDRLARIQSVCEQTLALPAEQRDSFLAQACGGDPELRDEVESLLAQHADAADFLERPAFGAPAVHDEALPAGTRLGPYQILCAIGEGGMGRVYKSRDTRLGRNVAIKVLADQFNTDPDGRARFEREARAIAGLSHPHICTLHDVGEYEGRTFLVMEHLDGDTLAARLRKGPLPIAEALEIAAELADALSAAHRQGIIHRDLKPANVILSRSGAKLLDFGLAKLKQEGLRAAASSGAVLPAGPAPLTAEGIIVGTVQYMAPEQIEGKPLDERTDIWALGVILYEMLTGRPAFEGDTGASVMAAVLQRVPPPPGTLQPLTPPAVDGLVRRCLAKAPDDRPDTAHDVWNELLWMRQTAGLVVGARVARSRTRARFVQAVALLGVGTAAGASGWLLRARLLPSRERPPLVRSELPVLPAEEVNSGGAVPIWVETPGGSRTALVWTADGRSLIFVGRDRGVQSLYVRSLDAAEARRLPGTEGAQVPAVAADGKWVAFWSGKAVKKVPLDGGPVVDLDSPIAVPPQGMVWATDGRLFCSGGDGNIWQISPGGGATQLTTRSETERGQIVSSMLPSDRGLLYTSRSRIWTWGDEEVVVLDLASRRPKVLLHDAADARYVTTGHLVFLRRGVLWAVPFDVETLEIGKPEVALLEGVAQSLSAGIAMDVTGAGQFAVAPNGSLAWIPARPATASSDTLVSVDRQGRDTPVPVPARHFEAMTRLSPDGRRLALITSTQTEYALWVSDLVRGTLTPVHKGGELNWPRWSPDGQRIAFESLEQGRFVVRSGSADGTGHPEMRAPGPFSPSSWLASGDLIGVAGNRLARAHLGKDVASVRPLDEPSAAANWPEVSPDGRWLAYGSNAGGRWETYVQPYGEPGDRIQASVDGGTDPAWNPSGHELFYVSYPDSDGIRRLMSVPFSAGAPPRLGTPRSLFQFMKGAFSFSCTPVRCYDVSPDGTRFYVFKTVPVPASPPVNQINLVQNWLDDLRARVPSAR